MRQIQHRQVGAISLLKINDYNPLTTSKYYLNSSQWEVKPIVIVLVFYFSLTKHSKTQWLKRIAVIYCAHESEILAGFSKDSQDSYPSYKDRDLLLRQFVYIVVKLILQVHLSRDTLGFFTAWWLGFKSKYPKRIEKWKLPVSFTLCFMAEIVTEPKGGNVDCIYQ